MQCASDPLPTRLLKECSDILAPFVAELCNRSLSTGSVPTTFTAAYIRPTRSPAASAHLSSSSSAASWRPSLSSDGQPSPLTPPVGVSVSAPDGPSASRSISISTASPDDPSSLSSPTVAVPALSSDHGSSTTASTSPRQRSRNFSVPSDGQSSPLTPPVAAPAPASDYDSSTAASTSAGQRNRNLIAVPPVGRHSLSVVHACSLCIIECSFTQQQGRRCW